MRFPGASCSSREAYAKLRDKFYWSQVEAVAAALLKHGTLDTDEFNRVIDSDE